MKFSRLSKHKDGDAHEDLEKETTDGIEQLLESRFQVTSLLSWPHLICVSCVNLNRYHPMPGMCLCNCLPNWYRPPCSCGVATACWVFVVISFLLPCISQVLSLNLYRYPHSRLLLTVATRDGATCTMAVVQLDCRSLTTVPVRHLVHHWEMQGRRKLITTNTQQA